MVHRKLFNPYVYRAILKLPEAARATADTAALVRKGLLGFLLRAGYTLAKVTTTLDENQIVAEIDEGQLDKILVLGVGAWDAVRFRYDFDLPNDVYNRPLVEERLDLLCQRFGLLRCTKTLIAVGVKEDNGPFGETALGLMEEMGISPSMLPSELERGARAYELQILLEPPRRHSNFWPSLDLGAPDGLLVGFGGYLADLPFSGGWIESRARAGGAQRSHLDGSGRQPDAHTRRGGSKHSHHLLCRRPLQACHRPARRAALSPARRPGHRQHPAGAPRGRARRRADAEVGRARSGLGRGSDAQRALQ